MSELIEGYEFYKSVQGTKYDKNNLETKNKLTKFRNDLKEFTNKIFIDNNGLVLDAIGNWQHSGNFSEYMWNRYKPSINSTNLVIYFNASTLPDEGMYISIGLNESSLSDFEFANEEKIYDFIVKCCEKIECEGFKRVNFGWGNRVFKIENINNYDAANYQCLLHKLKNVYEETIAKLYAKSDGVTMPQEKNNQPLNQILYGPPGTGKTYHTVTKALEIIDGFVPENREEVKAKFEAYKEAGQIEFVTFHQSYGYEEFVEGIKAKTTDSGGIEYKIEAGIFKKLSKRATVNFEQAQENIVAKKDFDVIFKERVLDKVSADERLEIKMKKSSFYIKEIDESHIYFDKSGGDSQHVLLLKNLRAMYEVGENKLIIGGLSQYYNPLLEYLLENNEVSQQEKEPLKNYILIIDEINRGNISKIFGELITLIEESKRIGKDEALHVRLPYSNESFGVPSNVYILGTMNTADRSIALMDTALRRRFDFTEMMPRFELLDFSIEGLHVKHMLEPINKRIEYLYDRDHTIGHAYFMELQEPNKQTLDVLSLIFKNKIIPLLQEYFYDDWEKIMMVLGDGFIEKSEIKSDIFDAKFRNTEYIEEEKSQYTIKDSFDFSEFKK